MKIILGFFLFILCQLSFGQNYTPFISESSKRFIDNNLDNSYFFYSTSETVVGDSIIFNQYYTSQEQIIDDPFDEEACNFWGGPIGLQLDTTWLGNQLIYWQSGKVLTLLNEEENSLEFDFGIALNDSAIFYMDDSLSCYIKFNSISNEDILNINDNVKHFEIKMYNSNGNSEVNPLDGFEILLGENLGLISFIDCYHFPFELRSLNLIGQCNPLIGNYQLSYLEAYPWQVGDIIQYTGYHEMPGDYTAYVLSYKTITITSRIETDTSVSIYFDTNINYIYSFPELEGELNPVTMPISNPLTFNKNDLIIDFPFNIAPINAGNVSEIQYANDYFEENLNNLCNSNYQLYILESFISFCDSCNCYGGYDGFGSTIKTKHYEINKGQTRLSSVGYGLPEDTDNWSVSQNYSFIGGIECGNQWILSIDELNKDPFEITPNPSNGIFRIKSIKESYTLKLIDNTGRTVYSQDKVQSDNLELKLDFLKPGCYYFQFQFEDGNYSSKKLIIQ